MFDMYLFEVLVIVILIGMKLFNELRRYVFVSGLYCHCAEFIETLNIEKFMEYF